MTRSPRPLLERLWLPGALVLSVSMLVGIWQAGSPRPQPRPVPAPWDSGATPKTTEQLAARIEQSLAQAGCPGWMALASEGPTALGPEVVPDEIRRTSAHVAEVPRVQYPSPLHVARRLLDDGATSGIDAEAQLVPSNPDADDDLLDGTPDLLWGEANAPDGIDAQDSTADDAAEQSPLELPNTYKPTGSSPLEIQNTHDHMVTPAPQTETSPEPARSTPEGLPQPVPTLQPGPFSPPPVPPSQAPHSVKPTPPATQSSHDKRSRCEFVAESQYPSAFACAECHQNIFDEWAVSSHAYAAVSPMFQKFEQKINDITQGTIGYFCMRCHSPVGTSLGVSRATPLWDQPQVAREGVTCVACHRVNQRYGKVNGERRIEPGDIFDPVYGSIGGSGVAEAAARKDHFKVKTSPHDKGPGQEMHVAGVHFDQLSKSEFCVSCHQVAVQPGIKLEVVWEQYRASPACKKGISCQDCHMGRIPGVPSGYETAPAAKINNQAVHQHRKHANHTFYGPGYSIAHPGVFPHNKDALRWSVQDWLLFDHRSGWGTDEFEEQVEAGRVPVKFPAVWAEADDRYDARDVIEDNLRKLEVKKLCRRQVMENGSHVDGPFFDKPPSRSDDLRFHYVVINTNEGHNLPSGSLGAQPQVWANVVLIGPRGNRLWESGYTDRWGDVADIHSEDVRNRLVPFDHQLFNLQTMFLITGAKGTDREFFLPINVDIDQLPYLRPGAQPISVINHPPLIRMEGRSLPPLGSRSVPYRVPAELLREPGCYRLSFRMRSRANPIYFMKFCNSTVEMQRAMNEWILDFHESSVQFRIE